MEVLMKLSKLLTIVLTLTLLPCYSALAGVQVGASIIKFDGETDWGTISFPTKNLHVGYLSEIGESNLAWRISAGMGIGNESDDDDDGDEWKFKTKNFIKLEGRYYFPDSQVFAGLSYARYDVKVTDWSDESESDDDSDWGFFLGFNPDPEWEVTIGMPYDEEYLDAIEIGFSYSF